MSRNYVEERHTLHHRIPKNALDIQWTDDKRNTVMIPEHYHTNWHRIFWNMEFQYQILKILEMNSTVVQKDVKRHIASIVQRDPKYVLVDGVYRPRNY